MFGECTNCISTKLHIKYSHSSWLAPISHFSSKSTDSPTDCTDTFQQICVGNNTHKQANTPEVLVSCCTLNRESGKRGNELKLRLLCISFEFGFTSMCTMRSKLICDLFVIQGNRRSNIMTACGLYKLHDASEDNTCTWSWPSWSVSVAICKAPFSSPSLMSFKYRAIYAKLSSTSRPMVTSTDTSRLIW
jgi:hypothetical protein